MSWQRSGKGAEITRQEYFDVGVASQTYTLHTKGSHNNHGKNMIKKSGPLIWNSIPEDIQKATSITAFKYQLKKYFFAQYDKNDTVNNEYARNYYNNNINKRVRHNSNNNRNNNNNNSISMNNHNNDNNVSNEIDNNFGNINIHNQFDGIRTLRRGRNKVRPIGQNWNGEGLESRWDN